MKLHGTTKQASLEYLPEELIEHVVQYSSLQDILNLRLTCRTVSSNASHGKLKTFFTTKQLDLRPRDILDFAERIKSGSLACNLEDLTVTGVLYVTKTYEKILRMRTVPSIATDIFAQRRTVVRATPIFIPLRERASTSQMRHAASNLKVLSALRDEVAADRSSQKDLQSLAHLFEQLRIHGRHQRLRTLKLDVVVVRYKGIPLAPKDGGDYRPIWDIAAHTFSVAVRALASASLTVWRIDAYSNLRGCSLSSHGLGQMLNEHASSAFNASFGNVKVLALSISNRPLASLTGLDGDPDDEAFNHPVHATHRSRARGPAAPDPSVVQRLQAQATEPQCAEGFAALLQMMPDLEELDLHLWRIRYQGSGSLLYQDTFPLTLLRTVIYTGISPLHNLRKLTLRGASPRSEELLTLLHANPELYHLDLRSVSLNGSWRPVFDYVRANDNNFRYLYFDVLFEDHAFVSFRQSAIGWTPAAGGAGALMVDSREKILEGIEYHILMFWMENTNEHMEWLLEHFRVYGPPLPLQSRQ